MHCAASRRSIVTADMHLTSSYVHAYHHQVISKQTPFLQSPTDGGGAETATKPADLATLAEQRQKVAAQLAQLEAQEQALRGQVTTTWSRFPFSDVALWRSWRRWSRRCWARSKIGHSFPVESADRGWLIVLRASLPPDAAARLACKSVSCSCGIARAGFMRHGLWPWY